MRADGAFALDSSVSIAAPLTTAKWLRRFREESLAGLQDRTSRPRSSPRRTAEILRMKVLELRHKRLTGREISKPSASHERRLVGSFVRAAWGACAHSSLRSILERGEPRGVETLAAELAIEALDVAVLDGLARDR